jgi:hypothetical protein
MRWRPGLLAFLRSDFNRSNITSRQTKRPTIDAYLGACSCHIVPGSERMVVDNYQALLAEQPIQRITRLTARIEGLDVTQTPPALNTNGNNSPVHSQSEGAPTTEQDVVTTESTPGVVADPDGASDAEQGTSQAEPAPEPQATNHIEQDEEQTNEHEAEEAEPRAEPSEAAQIEEAYLQSPTAQVTESAGAAGDPHHQYDDSNVSPQQTLHETDA